MIVDNDAQQQRPLSFPFEPPGFDGRLVDIVPGQIKWLRMPLPLALDHINLYLVRDGEGWCLVDTGLDTPATRDLWLKVLAGLDGPITRIVCTHHHGDHSGLAGWLTERLRIPLYMSRAEYFAMRLFNEPFTLDAWEHKEYFVRAGLAAAKIDELAKAMEDFRGDGNSPLARAYNRMRDGDVLTIGGRDWRVLGGDGHAPEHCSLYCQELAILLSGDQLLARISPNVGVLPFEPEANPLEDWLIALERIGRLPDDTLVLPAHDRPFHGLTRRTTELKHHHRDMLDRLSSLCAERPSTIYALSRKLFPGRQGALNDILAICETLSHLAYLLERGDVQRRLTESGSYEFHTVITATGRSTTL